MIVRLIEYGSHDLIEAEVREDGEVQLRRITFERDGHEPPVPRRDGAWTGSERRATPFRLSSEQHAALLADVTSLRDLRSVPVQPDAVRRCHDFIGSVLTLLADGAVVLEREAVWEAERGMFYALPEHNRDEQVLAVVWQHRDVLMPRWAVDETSPDRQVRDLSWRHRPRP